MSNVERSGTFHLGDLPVTRLGYGAMHLSGPGVFGPPTYCSFQAPHRLSISEGTSGRRTSSCRMTPSSRWIRLDAPEKRPAGTHCGTRERHVPRTTLPGPLSTINASTDSGMA